eukprot:12911253-Prorocentrum_lima.AAC.1
MSSKLCCTTSLNEVVSLEVASLEDGGRLNMRHTLDVQTISGMSFRTWWPMPAACKRLCMRCIEHATNVNASS